MRAGFAETSDKARPVTFVFTDAEVKDRLSKASMGYAELGEIQQR